MVNKHTVIAVNRFGLGARPGELERVDKRAHEWLHAQLDEPQTHAVVAGLPKTGDVLNALPGLQADVFAARQSGDADALREAQRQRGRFLRGHYVRQCVARYSLATATRQPFRERLVHFWTNHFAVSADKRPIQGIAGLFENEAIRPHVTGRFVDMLMAVEKHPAMIMYLDNQRSMGEHSNVARAAANRGQTSGLNENLAREILELHTLGVDGGYEQTDVTQFAEVLTGWSVGGNRRGASSNDAGSFRFRSGMHEPGAKLVLGKSYAERGVAQGDAVLEDLAKQPATASHIAMKLARHFVADAPPDALVDRLAAAFIGSNGYLRAVYEMLIDSPEPWEEPLAKHKTPQDFVISSYRALGGQAAERERIVASLTALGQRPYAPGSPAGWSDQAGAWNGANALLRRIEWAAAVSADRGAAQDPLRIATGVLGPVLRDHTRTSIALADDAAQGVALLLVSPEFQRR